MKMIQTTTRQPIKWQIQLYWWCLELISHDGVQECSKTRTSSFVAVSVRWIFSACFSKISSRWSDPVVKIEKQVSTKLIVHTGPGTHKLAAVAFKSPLKKQYFAVYLASISGWFLKHMLCHLGASISFWLLRYNYYLLMNSKLKIFPGKYRNHDFVWNNFYMIFVEFDNCGKLIHKKLHPIHRLLHGGNSFCLWAMIQCITIHTVLLIQFNSRYTRDVFNFSFGCITSCDLRHSLQIANNHQWRNAIRLEGTMNQTV